jgi:hypothetical protein
MKSSPKFILALAVSTALGILLALRFARNNALGRLVMNV